MSFDEKFRRSSKTQTDLGHKLLQACKKRDADSTEVFVLLRTGADVSMTGADGKSARVLAEENGRTDLVKMFDQSAKRQEDNKAGPFIDVQHALSVMRREASEISQYDDEKRRQKTEQTTGLLHRLLLL
jgi:hypothetical protein